MAPFVIHPTAVSPALVNVLSAVVWGISSANSGSAADSNSRTNSPGDTATALPVSPQSTTVNPNEITPLNTKPSFDHKHHGDHPITNDILRDNGITHDQFYDPMPNIPQQTDINKGKIFDPKAGFFIDKDKASAEAFTWNGATTYPTPNPNPATPGTACIDNSGSIEDEGYQYGYYDAQGHNGGKYEHGNHTDIWRQGYDHGFADGNDDEARGIYRTPC